jgi:hypothetical protein
MARKRYKPEEIAAKLRQVDVQVSQGQAMADAIRQIVNSDRLYLFINEHNKTGFAQYIDRSANFIRYVAGLSASQYADELRDAAKDFKYEIMAKMDRDNFMEWALPGNPERY